MRGGGRPLDPSTRRFLELRVGALSPAPAASATGLDATSAIGEGGAAPMPILRFTAASASHRLISRSATAPAAHGLPRDLDASRRLPAFSIARTDDPLERDADRAADRALQAPDVFAAHAPAFAADFSRVRVHAGPAATAAARALRARAFAFGDDIAFDDGAYQPDTPSGLWLLAHEVAHVAQRAKALLFRKASADPLLPTNAADSEIDDKDLPLPTDDDAQPGVVAAAAPAAGQGVPSSAAPASPALFPPPGALPRAAGQAVPASAGPAKQPAAALAPDPQPDAAGDKVAGKTGDKPAGQKTPGDLPTGDLALIDDELAEHERWGAAAAKVGAAGSKERAAFIAEQAGAGAAKAFEEGAVEGAKTTIKIKVAEKVIEKAAVTLAVRLGAQAAKFTPLPGIGAVIGGVMAGYDLAKRDWGATGKAIANFGKGADVYEQLANSIEAISNVIEVATAVANVIAGVLGGITVIMWAAAVATAGAVSPIAATLTAISLAIGGGTMVLDGINAIVLKELITMFRALHAFASDADPRDVVKQGEAIQTAAGGAAGFAGGMLGAKAAEKGVHLATPKPPAKLPGHPNPPAASGEGPLVKAEPPAAKAGGEPSQTNGKPAGAGGIGEKLPAADVPVAAKPVEGSPSGTQSAGEVRPVEMPAAKPAEIPAAAGTDIPTAKAPPQAETAAPAKPAEIEIKATPETTATAQEKAASPSEAKPVQESPAPSSEIKPPQEAVQPSKPETAPDATAQLKASPAAGIAKKVKAAKTKKAKQAAMATAENAGSAGASMEPSKPTVKPAKSSKAKGKSKAPAKEAAPPSKETAPSSKESASPSKETVSSAPETPAAGGANEPPAAKETSSKPSNDPRDVAEFEARQAAFEAGKKLQTGEVKATRGGKELPPPTGEVLDQLSANTAQGKELRLKYGTKQGSEAGKTLLKNVRERSELASSGAKEGHFGDASRRLVPEAGFHEGKIISVGVEPGGQPKGARTSDLNIAKEPLSPKEWESLKGKGGADAFDQALDMKLGGGKVADKPEFKKQSGGLDAKELTPFSKLKRRKRGAKKSGKSGAGTPVDETSFAGLNEPPGAEPPKTAEPAAKEPAGSAPEPGAEPGAEPASARPAAPPAAAPETPVGSSAKTSGVPALELAALPAKTPAGTDAKIKTPVKGAKGRAKGKIKGVAKSKAESKATAEARAQTVPEGEGKSGGVSPESEPEHNEIAKAYATELAEKGSVVVGPHVEPEFLRDLEPPAPGLRRGESALLGRSQVSKRVKGSLREEARRGSGKQMQEVQHDEGLQTPLTHEALSHMSPEQRIEVSETGKLPEDIEFHHLMPVADFPEVGHKPESGLPLPRRVHQGAGHDFVPSRPLEAATYASPGAAEGQGGGFHVDERTVKGRRPRATKRQIAEGAAATPEKRGGLNADVLIENRFMLDELKKKPNPTPKDVAYIRQLEKAVGELEKMVPPMPSKKKKGSPPAGSAPAPASAMPGPKGGSGGGAMAGPDPSADAVSKAADKPAGDPASLAPLSPKASQPVAGAAGSASLPAPATDSAAAAPAPSPAPEPAAATETVQAAAGSAPARDAGGTASKSSSRPSSDAAPSSAASPAGKAAGTSSPASSDQSAAPPATAAIEAAPVPATPATAGNDSSSASALPPAGGKAESASASPPQSSPGSSGSPGQSGVAPAQAKPTAPPGAGPAAAEIADATEAAEPIVERVNPAYQPPPATPDDLVSLRNQIIDTLAARAQAEQFAQLMGKQKAHHEKNEKPLADMKDGTGEAISATEAHQKAIAERDDANKRKGEQEGKVRGKIDDYATRAGQLLSLKLPLKGLARFTGLARSLPDKPGAVLRLKNGVLKMNGDATRFLGQLDQMDQTMNDQKTQQAEREKGVKADANTIRQTGDQADKSSKDLQDAKQTTDDFDKNNQARKEDASNQQKGAQQTSNSLSAQAKQKETQAVSLAAAMQFWARGHAKARADAVEQTRKRLADMGYRITEVRER
ncbi:DUF4157 domain-containing protein [Burkholderia ubonensis]|uniref:eCIS core domain-containing protein n=1 Tax=Burkholderia ubonensis TaxID=101571 RepID=UPI0018E1AF5F|nr:DUF4157 domain-containing protein [Burkholderia ubonensis]